MFLVAGSSGLELLGIIFIFILILVACYYTTKWISKSDLVNRSAKNITVLETYRISQGNVIQIVRTGKKYIVIGVSKDHIEMLTELSEDEYEEQINLTNQDLKFQDVLSLVKKETFGRKNKKTKSKE
ncbi:MAG TPA: hypothetical protein DCW90_09285 [Lachnospiraceae bacterium]|nr:flagellar biosynthetic protein FliO [uncultured Lachnoclostridium sp.]HAU85679.1 hypothetical protein [Lachnospiraceae bacterium]